MHAMNSSKRMRPDCASNVTSDVPLTDYNTEELHLKAKIHHLQLKVTSQEEVIKGMVDDKFVTKELHQKELEKRDSGVNTLVDSALRRIFETLNARDTTRDLRIKQKNEADETVFNTKLQNLALFQHDLVRYETTILGLARDLSEGVTRM